MGTLVHLTRRREWRQWLKRHHASKDGIWLVFNKKDSGLKRLPYEDAVEEALCYGWVDSLIRRIDEKRYARKFTPRRRGSRWSLLNRRRVARLIKEGRMTAAGLSVLDFSLAPRKMDIRTNVPRPPLRPPGFLTRALKDNGKAWTNFKAMAPSYRRLYIRWITAAKKEETRTRRLRESVERLSRNQKLGLK